LGQTNEIGARSFGRCSFAGSWAVVYLAGAGFFKDWRPARAHPFVAAWIDSLADAVP
jgi:hypothetical protein